MLKKVTFRTTFVALCTMLSLGAFAMADAPQRVDIPAGELSAALLQLSKQYHAELVYRPEQIYGIKTGGVHGQFTTGQAVMRLLQGTPLELRTDRSGAMMIAPPSSGGAQSAVDSTPSPSAPSQDPNDGSKEGRKSPSDEFRVAQDNQGLAPGAPSVDKSTGSALTEIIVTAQKRSERIQDVPVPVTAIDAETLTNSNQLRLQDYYNQIPGLTVAPASVAGYQLLSIRGISTGLANPTVGITVDDVPYGSSTVNGGNVPPDIDPGDLARIEVLRGPQGTLYGASSIGGLIKYVTVDPSTDAVSGRVQAGVSDVYNGAQLGYNVRGSVNVPLSDTWAVRVSGFSREDPGYIDNPVLDIDGINRTVAYGGHVAALWQPSAQFSLKLSALFQDTKAHGAADVDINSYALAPTVSYPLPPLGDLQQDYIPGTGGLEIKDQAYSATIHAKLGGIEVTSITGFNVNDYFNTTDFSWSFVPYTQTGVPGTPFHGFGVSGTPISTSTKGADKVTEELRLSSTIDALDWVVGGFYTHEHSPFPSWVYAENPTTGAIAGLFGEYDLQSSFEEYAAFSDLTFHFTDRFNIQVGGRESEIRQTYQDIETGDVVPAFDGQASPYIGPEGRSKVNAFTYLLTPQFKFSPDVMAYLRLASGYRAGGPNVGLDVPTQYEPDKTYNYELGVKGDVLEHWLSFDASVYYIDWKNIQVTLAGPAPLNTLYTGNAGGAKSQGVELSTEVRPAKGLSIASWVAFSDAVLTKAFPPAAANFGTYGVPGDRLPYASRISGHASIDDEFPLGNALTGSLGGEVSYTGNRLGILQGIATSGAPLPREELPGYAQVNLRAGVKYQSWSGNMFVNNVLDKRGVLDGGIGTNIPYAFLYIQPRTVGLNVVRAF